MVWSSCFYRTLRAFMGLSHSSVVTKSGPSRVQYDVFRIKSGIHEDMQLFIPPCNRLLSEALEQQPIPCYNILVV